MFDLTYGFMTIYNETSGKKMHKSMRKGLMFWDKKDLAKFVYKF